MVMREEVMETQQFWERHKLIKKTGVVRNYMNYESTTDLADSPSFTESTSS